MEALRTWRNFLGLTLIDVQRRVSPSSSGKMIPQQQWTRAEKRGVIPKRNALQRYCSALGIDYYHLFGLQAVIEERLTINPAYNHLEENKWLVQEFKRRLPPPLRVPPIPGPVFFDRKGIRFECVDS